jgi:hypothetical protein
MKLAGRTIVLVVVLSLGLFHGTVAWSAGPPPPVYCLDFGDWEMRLPGIQSTINEFVTKDNSLLIYVTIVINIIIVAIVAIALINIVVAGYIYLTDQGGEAGRVQTAKNLISVSLIGIILALAAFVILNTISPQFVQVVVPPSASCIPRP